MSLPDGVSLLPEGRLQFITQRGYFAPPYVQCMLAAISMVLAWTGYELPLPRKKIDTPPENFVYSLWLATGQTGDAWHGTNTAGTKRALAALLPDAPILYGAGTADELIQLLEDGAGLRVTAKCSRLPLHLRRWVGSYTGGHAFAIIGTRVNNGVREVFWMDPFGKPFWRDGTVRYVGEWIKWSDVSGVLDRGIDGIHVAFGYKSAAIPPINGGGSESKDMILSNVTELSRGTVGDYTPVLHPQTLVPIMRVRAGEIKLFGETPDGKYVGVLVNSRKIEGRNPKIALVEKSLVSNYMVDNPCLELEESLAAANEKIVELQGKLDADKVDANSILGR